MKTLTENQRDCSQDVNFIEYMLDYRVVYDILDHKRTFIYNRTDADTA
jgi:hypothetical protein